MNEPKHCLFFLRGNCRYGDRCYNIHPREAPECRFYLRGTCRFGDICVYKHSEGARNESSGAPIKRNDNIQTTYRRPTSSVPAVPVQIPHPASIPPAPEDMRVHFLQLPEVALLLIMRGFHLKRRIRAELVCKKLHAVLLSAAGYSDVTTIDEIIMNVAARKRSFIPNMDSRLAMTQRVGQSLLELSLRVDSFVMMPAALDFAGKCLHLQVFRFGIMEGPQKKGKKAVVEPNPEGRPCLQELVLIDRAVLSSSTKELVKVFDLTQVKKLQILFKTYMPLNGQNMLDMLQNFPQLERFRIRDQMNKDNDFDGYAGIKSQQAKADIKPNSFLPPRLQVFSAPTKIGVDRLAELASLRDLDLFSETPVAVDHIVTVLNACCGTLQNLSLNEISLTEANTDSFMKALAYTQLKRLKLPILAKVDGTALLTSLAARSSSSLEYLVFRPIERDVLEDRRFYLFENLKELEIHEVSQTAKSIYNFLRIISLKSEYDEDDDCPSLHGSELDSLCECNQCALKRGPIIGVQIQTANGVIIAESVNDAACEPPDVEMEHHDDDDADVVVENDDEAVPTDAIPCPRLQSFLVYRKMYEDEEVDSAGYEHKLEIIEEYWDNHNSMVEPRQSLIRFVIDSLHGDGLSLNSDDSDVSYGSGLDGIDFEDMDDIDEMRLRAALGFDTDDEKYIFGNEQAFWW